MFQIFEITAMAVEDGVRSIPRFKSLVNDLYTSFSCFSGLSSSWTFKDGDTLPTSRFGQASHLFLWVAEWAKNPAIWPSAVLVASSKSSTSVSMDIPANSSTTSILSSSPALWQGFSIFHSSSTLWPEIRIRLRILITASFSMNCQILDQTFIFLQKQFILILNNFFDMIPSCRRCG